MTNKDFPGITFGSALEVCAGWGLVCTAGTLRKLFEATISDIQDNDQLTRLHKQLRECLRMELENLRCLQIGSDRLKYWNEANTYASGESAPCHLDSWRDMLSLLPQEATDDLVEAGKCFACSRYTACVMHLCRLLECGFKNFIKRHNVSTGDFELGNSSWEHLRNSLSKHVDKNKSTLSNDEIAAVNAVRGQITRLRSRARYASPYESTELAKLRSAGTHFQETANGRVDW